jgi:hypothetical protein
MQRLFVSMMRFSTAMTLYGVEQMQTAIRLSQTGQDLFKVVDKFENVLNAMTDVLKGKIDERKQATLKSVTIMAEDVVNRSTDWINLSGTRSADINGNGAQPKPVADVLS